MLKLVVDNYRSEIEEMAEAWLAAGASTFGICEKGQLVCQWPATAVGQPPYQKAPITVRDFPLGELFVTGLTAVGVLERLEAQAALLARLTMTEAEMEALSTELIHNQDQLLALYDLVHSTRNFTGPAKLMQALVEAMSRLFLVETAFIWLEMLGSERIIAQFPQIQETSLLASVVDEVLQKGEQLLANGRHTTTRLLPVGITNVLILPLRFREQTVAAIGLVNNGDGAFETPAIKLLQVVAQYAESQIGNALLHELQMEQTRAQTRLQTEMDLARDVQMNLMPQRLPQVAGLDMAAATRPAFSVGGDFYDCMAEADGSLYFTLGDVSGKGMSAALLMAMTRTTMRTAVRLLTDNSPQEILDRTNEALYDDFTEVGMFATVFVGNWDPHIERLTYANAGHVPVIHRPAGGSAYLMEVTGTALSVLPENTAIDATIPFGEGDLLIAASDGLNEASNQAGELFNYERLINLIDRLADRPAAEIVRELYAVVAEFSQGHAQEDDQTIFVIKGIRHER